MSTVKISELVNLPSIAANTSNTIFLGVDVPTRITGKFTATTLAQQLYSNNALNVGNHPYELPNIIAQFAGASDNYLQVNLQNDSGNGSSDYVITNDIGTDSTNYLDLGLTGSTFNYPGYTVLKPSDGYLFVQGGVDSSTPGGNLVLGVATQNRDILFFQGGSSSTDVVAQFIYNSGFKLLKKPIIFADGTTQNTAAASLYYSQLSFDSANTNANDIVLIKATNAIQNANISTVVTKTQAVFDLANTNSNTITYITGVNSYQNTYSSAAFAKANAALANATGTFAGDLRITGNLVANSISTTSLVSFIGATTPATNSLVEIIGSASGIQQAPSNDGYMLHITGKANTPTRLVSDSFGANAYAVFAGRTGRGTAASPSAVSNNDVLLRISGNGWGTTGFAPLGSGRIDFVAAENYTDAARGSRIEFYNAVTGSNTLNKIASFNANTVEFTGTVNPQKGFVFTPRIPAGSQTAITIDFSADSIIKANLVADLTVSFTNYTAGKVVEVWLTNADNNNRTVTHGVTALRSTSKSTTFTILGQSSAYLRYFSIDGDLANTFVTITA